MTMDNRSRITVEIDDSRGKTVKLTWDPDTDGVRIVQTALRESPIPVEALRAGLARLGVIDTDRE
jgi:hypothetical protein